MSVLREAMTVLVMVHVLIQRVPLAVSVMINTREMAGPAI